MSSVESPSRSNEQPKSGLTLVCFGLGILLLMELVFWLDLLPILLLLWWQTLVVLVVVAILCLLVFLRRPAKRKNQFSVQTLLMLLLFFSWPLARLATQISIESKLIRKQQACIRALSNSPCQKVFSSRYNDGVRDNVVQKALITAGSPWLNQHNILQLCSLASLDLSGLNVSEEQLAAIVNTETVSELDLSSTNVTDDGIRQLSQLASLQHLVLSDTSISDAAIQELTDRRPDLDVER